MSAFVVQMSAFSLNARLVETPQQFSSSCQRTNDLPIELPITRWQIRRPSRPHVNDFNARCPPQSSKRLETKTIFFMQVTQTPEERNRLTRSQRRWPLRCSTEASSNVAHGESVVPRGLADIVRRLAPPLKRWAIVGCPKGTNTAC